VFAASEVALVGFSMAVPLTAATVAADVRIKVSRELMPRLTSCRPPKLLGAAAADSTAAMACTAAA
jgi:hypothetical protein